MSTVSTTPARWVARNLAPIVLGLLLLGYMFDAVYLTRSRAGQAGIYTILIIVSLFLAAAFAGLLAAAWLGRRAIWRTWGILLVVTLAITAAGALGHSLTLPRSPEMAPEALPSEMTAPEDTAPEGTEPEAPAAEDAAPEAPAPEDTAPEALPPEDTAPEAPASELPEEAALSLL